MSNPLPDPAPGVRWVRRVSTYPGARDPLNNKRVLTLLRLSCGHTHTYWKHPLDETPAEKFCNACAATEIQLALPV